MVLYVTTPGSHLAAHAERVVLEEPDGDEQSLRLRDVERVVIMANTGITSAALGALLEHGIETVFICHGGQFRGRLAPADSANVFLRQAQFRRYDDGAFRLEASARIVAAKVLNARALVVRHARNHPAAELDAAAGELLQCARSAETAGGLDELLGLEGDAARVYFAALPRMLRTSMGFAGRTGHPPRDPVNSLLSFGYALVTSEITAALAAVGLDPYVGVLHSLDYGRPSLALDLLEEFRSPLADRLALRIINLGVLGPGDFEDHGDDGVLMCDQARKRFLAEYHRVLDADTDEGGQLLDWRDRIRLQAARMRRAIESGQGYEPFRSE